MKILPVFLPNRGCENRCVFCSQKAITGLEKPLSFDELDILVERYLSTTDKFEIAFYGGTFTALDEEEQLRYLQWAEKYVRSGVCTGIRLSTKPNEIDEKKIELLKEHGVNFVELGVQSFDDEVLRESGRNYTRDEAMKACQFLELHGMDFGIHLMVGLPFDSYQKDVLSALETVHSGAKTCRIHPTLVLRDSPLEFLYRSGKYTPLSLDEATKICSDMVAVLESHNVRLIRLGLYVPVELQKNIVAGPFHPRFGELVRSNLVEKVCNFLNAEAIFHTPREASWVRKISVQKVPGERFGFLAHGNFVPWKEALKSYAEKLLEEVIACSKS